MRSCHALNSLPSRSSSSYARSMRASCSCLRLYSASSRRIAAALSFTSATGARGTGLAGAGANVSSASRVIVTSAAILSRLFGLSSTLSRKGCFEGSAYFSLSLWRFSTLACSSASCSRVGPSRLGGTGLGLGAGGMSSGGGRGRGLDTESLKGTTFVVAPPPLPAAHAAASSSSFFLLRYTFCSSASTSSLTLGSCANTPAMSPSTQSRSYSFSHSSRQLPASCSSEKTNARNASIFCGSCASTSLRNCANPSSSSLSSVTYAYTVYM
mmetsp:Transcript_26681/g.91136  ORF Transcript_26681/g.91136 Transcript_26681/m.91136 type:complete len:269 (+) Transcript_26681:1259-2065(+)